MFRRYIMKKIILLFLFVIVMVSCQSQTTVSTDAYTTISPADAQIMLENDDSVILLDVRTLSEYTAQRIPGALLLSLDMIESSAQNIIPDKNAKYIIYCRSGNRSLQAIEILLDLGYKNLYDLGGIINWPYEVVTG